GGWNVSGNADGQLTFTSPYGRQVTSTRQPLRPTTRAAAARISGTTLTYDPPSPERDHPNPPQPTRPREPD
ncbi:hypothetical protein, partial [Iamia sp.]|uniref:hypothetical protein n=1 Tax=Iamia sp. TaxID=2722710 RepID=UPI002CC94F75